MLTKAFRLVRFYIRKYVDRSLLLLDEWLVAIYCSPSRLARLFLTRPTYELRRLLLLLRRGLSFKVFVLRGTASVTNALFSVAYFASGDGMSYLESLLFADGQAKCEQRESCSLWALAKTAAELAREVDLVVVERNSLLRWKPSCGSWVVGPTWVRMVFDFVPGQSWEQVQARFKKQQKNIRYFRKNGYTYSVSRQDEDFDHFYHRMHIPLIDTRHKGYGLIDGKQNLYKFFKQGFVMFALNRENQPVAGDLDSLRGDVMLAVVNGVLDGERKWMQEGALNVLYYYELQWCHEHGLRRCDIGGARPFAHNGLYTHKRRWGFQPVRGLWQVHDWLLWAPHDSPVAMQWLEAHPFIPEFAQVGSKSLESMYQGLQQSPAAKI